MQNSQMIDFKMNENKVFVSFVQEQTKWQFNKMKLQNGFRWEFAFSKTDLRQA